MKCVFVDKDGTLVYNLDYPSIPTDKLITDRVIDGLRAIKEKGYKIILVSNQSWIAKNLMSKSEVENIFISVKRQLDEQGVKIDDYIYCPHQISDGCNCKKPKPGMILEMARKHNINLSKSFMVGDMAEDILAGKSAGVRTVLVLTGNRKDEGKTANPDYIIDDLNKIEGII